MNCLPLSVLPLLLILSLDNLRMVQASWSIKEVLLDPNSPLVPLPMPPIDQTRSGEQKKTANVPEKDVQQQGLAKGWNNPIYSILFGRPSAVNRSQNVNQGNGEHFDTFKPPVIEPKVSKQEEEELKKYDFIIKNLPQNRRKYLQSIQRKDPLSFPRTDQDSFVLDARRDWYYPVAALSGFMVLLSAALFTWLYMDSYDNITIPVEAPNEANVSKDDVDDDDMDTGVYNAAFDMEDDERAEEEELEKQRELARQKIASEIRNAKERE